MEMGGIAKWGHWEVIDLGGAAKMILGRPWLRDIAAVHDYSTDVIHIEGEDGKRELKPAQIDHKRMEEYGPEQEEEEMRNGQPALPEVPHAEDSTAMFPLFGHARCKTSSCCAALAVEFGDDEEDSVDDEGADTQT